MIHLTDNIEWEILKEIDNCTRFRTHYVSNTWSWILIDLLSIAGINRIINDIHFKCRRRDILVLLEIFPDNIGYNSIILNRASELNKLKILDLFFNKEYKIDSLRSQFWIASSRGNINCLNKLIDLVKWRDLEFPIYSWIDGSCAYPDNPHLNVLEHLNRVYRPSKIPTSIWRKAIDDFVNAAWIDGLIWIFKGTYAIKNLTDCNDEVLDQILRLTTNRKYIQKIIDHISENKSSDPFYLNQDRVVKKLRFTDKNCFFVRPQIDRIVFDNQHKLKVSVHLDPNRIPIDRLPYFDPHIPMMSSFGRTVTFSVSHSAGYFTSSTF